MTNCARRCSPTLFQPRTQRGPPRIESPDLIRPGGQDEPQASSWVAGAPRAFGDVRQAARGLNAGLAVAIMTSSMCALSGENFTPGTKPGVVDSPQHIDFNMDLKDF